LARPALPTSILRVFAARGISQGAAVPDEGEFIDVAWLPVGAVVSAIRAGVIQDAKTVAGVLAILSEGTLGS